MFTELQVEEVRGARAGQAAQVLMKATHDEHPGRRSGVRG